MTPSRSPGADVREWVATLDLAGMTQVIQIFPATRHA
jgi:hypothetical protein